MAVVAPFLVVLGLGIFEFSNLFYHRQLIVTGLHDAARYLARVEDPTDTTEQTRAKELAVYGRIGGTVSRVPWWTVANVDINPAFRSIANPVDPGTGLSPYRGPDPIVIIRVSTAVDHPSLGFLPVLGIDSLVRINVFHEERHIGD
jgi:hypothetical protein